MHAVRASDSLTTPAQVLPSSAQRDGSVNFYNLTLNRVAEISEVHALATIPTGSLLVSIDQHHDDPEHPLDRTIGSEVNVLSSLKVILEVLEDAGGDIVFKAFDRADGKLPMKHGDFGKLPFWRPSTWKLDESQSGGTPFPVVN